MSEAFYITSTGTDIGKTFVTSALIHQLRKSDRPVHAIKPVITGFDPVAPEHSDSAEILTALEIPLAMEAYDQVSPWRFFAPLSPHIAAEREGKTLSLKGLVTWCRTQIDAHEFTLIEGAGGVMAPLNADATMRDWMAALNIPVILVVGSYLGTFSHTLTAIEALQARGITPHAIVISASTHNPMPLEDTVAGLRQFAPDVRHIIGLPRVGGWQLAPDLLPLLT
jgi:dethiobiotin synthetase